jgi:hypothetical protein
LSRYEFHKGALGALAWQCSCRDYDEGAGTALVLFTVTRFDRIPLPPTPRCEPWPGEGVRALPVHPRQQVPFVRREMRNRVAKRRLQSEDDDQG